MFTAMWRMSSTKKIILGLLLICLAFGSAYWFKSYSYYYSIVSQFDSNVFIDHTSDDGIPGISYGVECVLPVSDSGDVQVEITETQFSSAFGPVRWEDVNYNFTVSLQKYESAMESAFGSDWRNHQFSDAKKRVDGSGSILGDDEEHYRCVMTLIKALEAGQDLDAIEERIVHTDPDRPF